MCVCVEPNLKYLSVECSCALEPSLDIENMPLKQRIPFVESMQYVLGSRGSNLTWTTPAVGRHI